MNLQTNACATHPALGNRDPAIGEFAGSLAPAGALIVGATAGTGSTR